uniref:Ig-like domain-containing protein n=1 Tax=Naja naja TaxID=35670 RepID=A0A8C6X8V3_NAJNA
VRILAVTDGGVFFFSGAALAVRINEDGHKVIYLPKGESVKLGCPFSSDPEDNTPDNDWDIQWKQVKPGPHPQYNPLLGYHDHRIIYPGPPDLQKRVGFISSNPSLYDASMQLRDLQMSDSATYECTVKKTTEATRKVTITVQEKPALPRCWIIGEIAYGNSIMLRCLASTGSPPLSYHWSMAGGNYHDWMPSASECPPSCSLTPGDLQIRDLCDDHVGIYECSVGNNVGTAYCSVEIQFGGGKGKVGVQKTVQFQLFPPWGLDTQAAQKCPPFTNHLLSDRSKLRHCGPNK